MRTFTGEEEGLQALNDLWPQLESGHVIIKVPAVYDPAACLKDWGSHPAYQVWLESRGQAIEESLACLNAPFWFERWLQTYGRAARGAIERGERIIRVIQLDESRFLDEPCLQWWFEVLMLRFLAPYTGEAAWHLPEGLVEGAGLEPGVDHTSWGGRSIQLTRYQNAGDLDRREFLDLDSAEDQKLIQLLEPRIQAVYDLARSRGTLLYPPSAESA